MIRMMLLLCAGLFLTLQIAGEDRGQMRFGLMEAANASAGPVVAVVDPVADEPDAPPGPVAAAAPLARTQDAPVVVPVVFGAAQPAVVRSAPEPVTVDTATEVRFVTGRSVNVRSGPSTRNAVLGRLSKGEAVTLVGVEDNGWARVRVEGDGIDGFMAMSFLSTSAP